MGRFQTNESDIIPPDDTNGNGFVMKQSAFDRFNASLLGLGDIEQPSETKDTIAAVFDLEGFTDFCKQIEPHLSVPTFLNDFLNWIMAKLASETVERVVPGGVKLWMYLPYWVKFMGDGILVLWDSSQLDSIARRNVVVSAHAITLLYKNEFYPAIRQKVTDAPRTIRCGIARGNVFSVGDGNDYVGSCINMASRLQKMPGLSFAYNIRGFEVAEDNVTNFFKDTSSVKRVAVRGIGENELIGVLNSEFESLDEKDKALFRPL